MWLYSNFLYKLHFPAFLNGIFYFYSTVLWKDLIDTCSVFMEHFYLFYNQDDCRFPMHDKTINKNQLINKLQALVRAFVLKGSPNIRWASLCWCWYNSAENSSAKLKKNLHIGLDSGDICRLGWTLAFVGKGASLDEAWQLEGCVSVSECCSDSNYAHFHHSLDALDLQQTSHTAASPLLAFVSCFLFVAMRGNCKHSPCLR